ncbi:Uma2 family endonuclease [Bradyrhizobium liaoningense]|uniref:Uma2 family endonuclease n=1 Tax=Bradyrhizobium liaoningense TaxID=43992 RepID=UPI001BAAA6B0|nr:Uma2 family endonuclease [Bradyrhizobium liaoningense]MBR0707954.1 Uma2 family endonuclease [Bradyrhizobium liaoningense]
MIRALLNKASHSAKAARAQRDPDETDEEYAARRALFEHDEDETFEMPGSDRGRHQNHEHIVMNIVGALKPAMDRIGCLTYVRMAVRRDEESRATELRPDILVRRGPVLDQTYINDPILVIEVMSSGSKLRDEHFKHSYYWNLPTIRHIVLVDAERMAVQHDIRTEGGYVRSILTDAEAVIDLAEVGFSITLESVYSGIVAE